MGLGSKSLSETSSMVMTSPSVFICGFRSSIQRSDRFYRPDLKASKPLFFSLDNWEKYLTSLLLALIKICLNPFYAFLRSCLNLPFVKVILSLREDYLHYLLECDRFTNLDVINQIILDKNIRYYLGDFSPERANTSHSRINRAIAVLFTARTE
jgi:hypothetical protein